MVERIYGKYARANVEDSACGPDHNFTSKDECISDNKIEELFNEADI